MNESKSRPLLNLYLDDSGTRHPDKVPPAGQSGDWFALGGILINDEHETEARRVHSEFCKRWKITYPLHSVKIRHKNEEYSWLKTVDANTADEFYAELQEMLLGMPVLGHACVIDRPGYYNRYYAKYGRERWRLCKTAFSVICERVAKLAILDDRRVRIWVEESDKVSDAAIRSYFRELREVGMPFDKGNSGKYEPLSAVEMKYRLLDLSFKKKSSAMIQIADLFLYPICKGKYQPAYRPLIAMMERKKLIDCELKSELLPQLGVKYSCFDLDSKKGLVSETLKPASKSETS